MAADDDHALAEATATINVVRDIHPSLAQTAITMKAWENPQIPKLNGMPNDYDGQITYESSDNGVAVVEGGRLKFGGSGYGRSATITVKIPQTRKYKGATLKFTVNVDNEMRIASREDWKKFCDLVNSGKTSLNVKLMKDIDLGTDITMAGGGKSYSGTFDGQGHALKINWNSGDRKWIAPFQTVDGATIKNLRTEGEINSNTLFLSGLIYDAYGNTTISGCVSAVNITSSYNEGGCNVAGIIECVRKDAKVTITDCIVKGTFNATMEKGRGYMGGFVCNQYGTCTLTNCLYAGTNNASGGYTFCTNYFSGTTLNNCYYLSRCGEAQGTQATKEQLRSGEVAHKLQVGRQYTIWGQDLDSDNEPQLTADAAKHVYEVKFTYNNKVAATRYATNGKGIHGGMPTFTAKDLMGSSYNEHHFYTIAFEGDFNGSTTVSSDRIVAVLFNHKEAYEIASKDNWKTFCALVDGGQTKLNAKMTKDVDLGSDIVMVGVTRNYSGTFDGGEHTLKINWNSVSARQLAPFQNVKGATISNLRTEGYIKSNTYGLSGLIYSVDGATTISGCVSNVDLTSSYDKNAGCDASGMVHHVTSGASVEFTDCLVKGKFHATTDNGKKGMGGFVYGQYGTCKLTNCLYIGKNNATSNSNTFAKDATVKNCYYLNACGTAQGEKVTAEQLKSGEVAYLLQNKRAGNFWGQELGKENDPLPTDKAEKHVCKVTFTCKDQVKATRYATRGKAIFGDMPTVTPQFLLGSDYNSHHYYRYGFSEYFTASTPVNADRTVGLFIEDRDYYEIASKDDWRRFCDLVRDGQNGVDAKMTVDINLSSDFAMVGSDEHRYAGTFDGQGHTLTISWDTGSKPWVAPFNTVEDATIKNLRTAGNINSSTHFLSGLVCDAYGTTTISDCISAVNITSTYGNASCDAAGMVECVRDNANVTITDCVVKGKIDATTENGKKYMGGFVNNQYGKCALISCLYLGENNATGGNTFASNSSSGSSTTLKNCYYFKACGKPQGEQATEKQLKSGYVTNKLQADRTDQCHWAQTLGERPELYNPADKGKMNYVYHDGDKWACGEFYFTDEKPLPIGLDFTAATVIYQRSFSFAGMSGTICLPYELPVQRFRAYTLSGGQGNKLYFKEVTGTLEAYKPYYITGLGVNPTLSGNNMQVKAFHDDNLTTATTTGHSMTGTVEGVDNATAAAANAYILQDDGDFHKVTTEYPNAMVPAYHTYIVCPKASAGAKQLSVILDGEATGIHGVTNSATDGPVYDLQGRRVVDRLDDARHRLPAGVYIVGGRKVILK